MDLDRQRMDWSGRTPEAGWIAGCPHDLCSCGFPSLRDSSRAPTVTRPISAAVLNWPRRKPLPIHAFHKLVRIKNEFSPQNFWGHKSFPPLLFSTLEDQEAPQSSFVLNKIIVSIPTAPFKSRSNEDAPAQGAPGNHSGPKRLPFGASAVQ